MKNNKEENGYEPLIILSKSSLSKTFKAIHKETGSIVLLKKINSNSYLTESQIQEKFRFIDDFEIQNSVHVFPYYSRKKVNNEYILHRQYYHKSLKEWIIDNKSQNKLPERNFIAFQILRAVKEVHSAGYYHGDINTNNIMLTSYNWVILTDFGCYKPTYLQQSEPIIFSTYFCKEDYHRSCYLAPERFYSHKRPREAEISALQAMDLFSVGCVLYELFTSQTMFTYGDLLDYKSRKTLNEEQMENLDFFTATIIRPLLSINPKDRLSIQNYTEPSGKQFRDWFSHFHIRGLNNSLYNYLNDLKEFSSPNQIIQLNFDFVDNSKILAKYKGFYSLLLQEIKERQPTDNNDNFKNHLQNLMKYIQENRFLGDCEPSILKFKKFLHDKKDNIEKYFDERELKYLPFFINLNLCYYLIHVFLERSNANDNKDRSIIRALLQIKISEILSFFQIESNERYTQIYTYFDSINQIQKKNRFLNRLFSTHELFIARSYLTNKIELMLIKSLSNKQNDELKHEKSLKNILNLSWYYFTTVSKSPNFQTKSVFDILSPGQSVLFVPYISHALQSNAVVKSPQLLILIVEILRKAIENVKQAKNHRFSDFYSIIETLNIILSLKFPSVFKAVANLIYSIAQTEELKFDSKDAAYFFEVILPKFLEAISTLLETNNLEAGNVYSNLRFAGDIFAKLLLVVFESDISNSILISYVGGYQSTVAEQNNKLKLLNRFSDYLKQTFKSPRESYEFLVGFVPHIKPLIFNVYGNDHFFYSKFLQILFNITVHSIGSSKNNEKSDFDDYSQSYYFETHILLMNQFDDLYSEISSNYESSVESFTSFLETLHENLLVFLFSLLKTPPPSQYIYALIISTFQKYYEMFRFSNKNNCLFSDRISKIISISQILIRIFTSIKNNYLNQPSTSNRLQKPLISAISKLILSVANDHKVKSRDIPKLIEDSIISQLLIDQFSVTIHSITAKNLSSFFMDLKVSDSHNQLESKQQSEQLEATTETKYSAFSRISTIFLSPFYSSPSSPRRTNSNSDTSSNSSSSNSSGSSSTHSNQSLQNSNNSNNSNSNNSNSNNSNSNNSNSNSNIVINSKVKKIVPNKIAYSNLTPKRINLNSIDNLIYQYILGNFQSIYPSTIYGKIHLADIIRLRQEEHIIASTTYAQICDLSNTIANANAANISPMLTRNSQSQSPSQRTRTLSSGDLSSGVVTSGSQNYSDLLHNTSTLSSTSSGSSTFNRSGSFEFSGSMSGNSASNNYDIGEVLNFLSTETAKFIKKTSRPLATTLEIDSSKYNFIPHKLDKNRALLSNCFVGHTAKINKLEVSMGHHYFFSCSDDCFIRVWDARAVGDKRYQVGSKHSIQLPDKVRSISYINSSYSLGSITKNGKLFIHDIEHNKEIYSDNLATSRSNNSLETFNHLESYFKYMDKNFYDPSLFICSTSYGRIILYDIRDRKSADSLNNISHGAITSMIVDPSKNTILIGNNYGVYSCWDIRYKVPLLSWSHSFKRSNSRPDNLPHLRINHLMKAQNITQYRGRDDIYPIISTVENEIYLWDVYTQTCLGIWRSLPFSDHKSIDPNYFHSTNNHNNSLNNNNNIINNNNRRYNENFSAICSTDKAFLTGGYDSTLRYWDLHSFQSSFLFSSPRSDLPSYSLDHYHNIPVYTEYSDYNLLPHSYAQLDDDLKSIARLKIQQYRKPNQLGSHSGHITGLQIINHYNSLSLLSSSSTGEIKSWASSPFA